MTPPDANLDRQKRRHWPVLIGIAGAVLLAVLGWFAYGGLVGAPETDPADETSATPADTPSAAE